MAKLAPIAAARARRLTRTVARSLRASAERRRRPRPEAPRPAGRPEPPGAGSGRGPLVVALERGTPLDEAILQEVRALLAAGRGGRAQAIGESLLRDDAVHTLGRVAAGIAAHARGFPVLAWAHLQGLDAAVWGRLAPGEHVRAGLAVAPEAALEDVRRLVDADPPEVRAQAWLEIVTALLGGDQDLARAAFARFDRHVDMDHPGWEDGPRRRARLRPWIEADAGSPAPPHGRPVLAVLGGSDAGADEALEAIAALGHIVRHRNLRLHGERGLLDVLATLRGRVRADRRLDDLDADLEVRILHPDAAGAEPIPEGAWVVCCGACTPLPRRRGLLPLFIGFHCTDPEVLTSEALEHLGRHGPVGCRDWTTVHVLTSAGVPAFFSGALTTTIGDVFPDAPPPPAGAPPLYVDVAAERVPRGAAVQEARRDDVALEQRVRRALDRLEHRRREHPRVVTSRLDLHLALRSVGAATDLVPDDPADARLDGLAAITDAAFAAVRDGIAECLEAVVRRIVAGAPEEEVRDVWRKLTAAGVTAAQEERRRPVELAPADDWPPRIRRARGRAVTRARTGTAAPGETVHCAVLVDQPGPRPLAALLDSLVAHASRPLHVHVVAAAELEDRLGRSFPELTLTRIPPAPLGARGRRLRRLLLPALLPDVGRVVVLPLPSVATADVAELADLDLGDHALAAPRRLGTGRASGFGVVDAAALRLRDRPAAAFELRRAALARHAFDWPAFGVDVLVMDLARMRRDRVVEEGLALAEAFGVGDLAVLQLLFGPDRATLPERWAIVPTRTLERAPGLLHWADAVKPWQARLTPEREVWRRHAVAL